MQSAWAGVCVSATTNCQAPTLGHKSGGRGFPRVLRAARGGRSGVYPIGPRVFAECCSLGRVGASHETEDSNVLALGAQPGKYAFESCPVGGAAPCRWT